MRPPAPDRLAEISARAKAVFNVPHSFDAAARFIIGARDDIPWLLAEVERLRAELEKKR